MIINYCDNDVTLSSVAIILLLCNNNLICIGKQLQLRVVRLRARTVVIVAEAAASRDALALRLMSRGAIAPDSL